MAGAQPHRTLIVANLTAATPMLLEEVERRARATPTQFALLIPELEQRKEDDWTAETALPLLEKAAREPVEEVHGGTDPYEAIKHLLADGDFDDVILSTPHHRIAGLLHRDLAHRVNQLGVPVTIIASTEDHLQAPTKVELAGPLT